MVTMKSSQFFSLQFIISFSIISSKVESFVPKDARRFLVSFLMDILVTLEIPVIINIEVTMI